MYIQINIGTENHRNPAAIKYSSHITDLFTFEDQHTGKKALMSTRFCIIHFYSQTIIVTKNHRNRNIISYSCHITDLLGFKIFGLKTRQQSI